MLAEGENVNVEFKECGKAFPKEFWPTYSAFANTRGGWIILGVKEFRDRELPDKFQAVGIEDVEKIISELGSQLDNKQKVNKNLLTDDDVFTVDVDGAQLLVVHVPEADYLQKPIYLNGNKVDHSYKRTFEGDAHLTDEELSIMLRDAIYGESDLMLMEHYDMRHIDAETLRKYRTVFNLHNPGHIYSDLNDKEFLIQLGGYVIDETSGKEGLTMAGILMFGKGLVVRNLFPNLRMDYIDTTGIEEGSAVKWIERLTYDGRWENNLYNFISYVMAKITFGLPNAGIIEGMVRQDDSLVNKALREGVTNSVIHADFRIEGILRIEKRGDRIELHNPGLLKLSREKIYKGRNSRSRNPKIQDMLRMIGYGDNIGSGFPLILRAWREEQWIQPDLIEDRELHQVSLIMKMSCLYGREIIAQLKELFGNKFDNLTSHEKECLVLIVSEKCQSNSELQLATGKNGWEINRILGHLIQTGFLLSHPNGRWTTYSPNTEFLSKQETKQETKQEILPTEILNILPKPQRKILEIINKEPALSMRQVAEITGLSRQNISTIRKNLRSIGIELIHRGPTKSGIWEIKFLR